MMIVGDGMNMQARIVEFVSYIFFYVKLSATGWTEFPENNNSL
jgi:hypothetical protein